jgi:hypothetical protein
LGEDFWPFRAYAEQDAAGLESSLDSRRTRERRCAALLEYDTISSMQWRNHGRLRGALRLGFVILLAALAGRGRASSGQAPPENDAANQHTITVVFGYDFGKIPSCAEKPALKTCIKQFVVYDVSGKRFRLFTVPVPEGARGFVSGIKGESPRRIFLPGKHIIAVTAQNGAGVESDVNGATVTVQVKPKAVESGAPAQ